MINSSVNELSWESDFFCKKIGSIANIDIDIDKDELSHFDLICNKVAASDYISIDILNKSGFNYVEGEVLLTKKIEKKSTSIENSVEAATESDLNSLLKISNDMFKFSRFRSPWFSANQTNEFYGLWIKNAILCIFDDVCFVVKSGLEVKGFITLKKNEESVSIGLLGVSSKYQGCGIGHTLLEVAENYASNFGLSQVKVSTQVSNIPAIKLYLKAEYSLGEINYWFYKDNVEFKNENE